VNNRDVLIYWSRRVGLNHRPADYESAALPLSYAGNDEVRHQRLLVIQYYLHWCQENLSSLTAAETASIFKKRRSPFDAVAG
jgi:hypothetical protein